VLFAFTSNWGFLKPPRRVKTHTSKSTISFKGPDGAAISVAFALGFNLETAWKLEAGSNMAGAPTPSDFLGWNFGGWYEIGPPRHHLWKPRKNPYC